MNDITEGLGTAVEGGLLAKAVSKPSSTDGEAAMQSGSACLNCGTQLIGAHCHACGQKAAIRRTISALIGDLIHGVLHLDGKLWRTLPLLAFKPGKLTRRYIDGERASFVSPMAMFLFTVFLMFAVFQAVGLTAPTSLPENANLSGAVSFTRGQIQTQLETAREELEQLDTERSADERAELEQRISDLETNLTELDEAAQVELPQEANFQFEPTGFDAIDEGLVKKWRENPGLMLYKLQANGYKFSWLLIPLSIPFVWLVFAWKRRFKAYDHAVFVTYSLAFMSALFITLSLINATGLISGGWVFLGLALLPPLHLYKHLRHTYGLSRFGTLWRLFYLMIVILLVIVLFLQALILLGAF